ncbi:MULTISPECIES: ABC transporter permease [unclassified Streptomyces]|uniref:ABC transporter permease n=1 Tax=unclassified Streptomyces TaxID=2593676 RepID=UPI0037FA1CD1
MSTLTAVQPGTERRGRSAGGWQTFAVRRGLGFVLSFAFLVLVTFLIVPLLPGDPARAILGTRATPASIAALRDRFGLDDPLLTRLGDYVGGLLHLDLGTSYRYGTPVAETITTKLPYTLTLTGLAIAVVLAVGVPLGMLAGVLTRGGRRPRLGLVFGSVAGFMASIPGYVTGTILIVVASIWLGLLPPGGATEPTSVILPVLSLALGPTFAVARVVRQETQNVIEQDFMRTARGRRLRAARLYVVHALPNLLTSTLTLCGLIVSGMIGAAVVIESVFNYPGIGQEIVQAIIYKDYPVVQGIVLVLGLFAITVNLLIDVILGFLDPRTLGGRDV